jgi:uncharacterized membrane protein YgdD (TMEM256/DUF423 family)
VFRIWIFISGIVALGAVAAGAWGAHALTDLAAYPRLASSFESALRFHLIHAIALFGVAILYAATEGRRNAWGAAMLGLAAVSFLIGIALFSGGIYYQVFNIQQTGLKIVPAGGIAFMIGWVAVSLSAFGYRRASTEI